MNPVSACWNVVISVSGERALRASMRRRSVGASMNGRSHESTRIGCRSSRSAAHTPPNGPRPGSASGMERMPGRAGTASPDAGTRHEMATPSVHAARRSAVRASMSRPSPGRRRRTLFCPSRVERPPASTTPIMRSCLLRQRP